MQERLLGSEVPSVPPVQLHPCRGLVCLGTIWVFLYYKCKIILLGLPGYRQGISPHFMGCYFPILWDI